MSWLIAGALLVAGFALGFVVARMTQDGQAELGRVRQQLNSLQTEYRDYRARVESHFQDTATAVQAMAQNYRAVFDQLRNGANALCERPNGLFQLQQAEPPLESDSEPQAAEPQSATAPAEMDEEPQPTPPKDYADEGSSKAYH